MRILYIEDNPNDARLVKRYVDTTSHELTIVQTLEDSYAALAESQSFDLILADILLNNQRSGFELPRVLREQGYTCQVIAITALNSPQDQAACAKAGFAAVVTKPFLMKTLADTLTQFSNIA